MRGVILGLGSNEGERMANLKAAIRAIDQSPEFRVLRVSPLYESDAMLEAGAPAEWNQPFLNVAVECVWRGERPTPQRLLDRVQAIERSLGRRARERWAPRPIDIDILDWDGGAVAEEGLHIPHRGLGERPFALLPFADLWPETITPSAWESALQWRLADTGDAVPFRSHRSLRSLTSLVGVLNLTPDSFSDGGRFAGDARRALEQGSALLAAGADVLDLGSESTRPGATPVSPREEISRLIPALDLLRAELPREVPLSVDTRHAEVAREALRHGASWINDVTGFEDPAMLEAVCGSDCRIVAMHSLGIPPSRGRVIPEARDPIDFLLEWGKEKLAALDRAGIARSRVILDPGIGFGTSPRQSWEILAAAERLHALGCEILIGHSRKSFLAEVTDLPASERDLETATLSAQLAGKGIEWLRVHDVEFSARAVRGWTRVDGLTHWGPKAGSLRP